MSSYPYSSQRALFKAYDIRGKHGLFTDAFVWDLSRLFATDVLSYKTLPSVPKPCINDPSTAAFLSDTLPTHIFFNQAPIVVVGYDVRHGSLQIAEKLAHTFAQNGLTVIWLGLVTTPMMAFWAHNIQGHGFIATASHSEKDIIGIKWLINGQSPSSACIQTLYDRLSSLSMLQDATLEKAHGATDTTIPPSNLLGGSSLNEMTSNLARLDTAKAVDEYIKASVEAIDQVQTHAKLAVAPSQKTHTTTQGSFSEPLKIVIDCLNGATGPHAQAFFSKHSKLCRDVIVINDRPDGDFPKGNPDPTESGRLDELSTAVIQHQADLGLAFDGDGDRLMVVDNQGKILAPDHLLYLLALVALDGVRHDTNDTTSETVIFDVKCSHHLPQLIEQIGATPQMAKTGSSLMRRALQTADKRNDKQAIFAGELSGHFLFNDGYFTLHDDAMYAALRLIHWLTCQPAPNSQQLFLTDPFTNAGLTPKTPHLPSCLSCIIEQLPHMVSTCDVYLPLTVYNANDSLNGSDENTLISKFSNLCHMLQQNCQSTGHNHSLTEFCQASLLNKASEFGLPKNTRLTTIDGIRLDFPNGFGVMRKSNTSHCLTVRFAGNCLDDLKNIQQYFVMLCQSLDANLANHIANIQASA